MQSVSDLKRPLRALETVAPVERQRHPFQTESDAGRVSGSAVSCSYAERLAEEVLVIIDGADRRRTFFVCDWSDDLELQPLIALSLREERSASPEERIRCDFDPRVQPERLEEPLDPATPGVAPRHHRLGIRRPDVLVLTKHLHPREVFRRLVTEAERHDVEETSTRRQSPGEQRIERIAGRRSENDFRCRKPGAP